MTEDQQPQAVRPATPAPESVAGTVETPPERYPALLESLAALGLIIVVAYTCWRLYGAEIANMAAVLFRR